MTSHFPCRPRPCGYSPTSGQEGRPRGWLHLSQAVPMTICLGTGAPESAQAEQTPGHTSLAAGSGSSGSPHSACSPGPWLLSGEPDLRPGPSFPFPPPITVELECSLLGWACVGQGGP